MRKLSQQCHDLLSLEHSLNSGKQSRRHLASREICLTAANTLPYLSWCFARQSKVQLNSSTPKYCKQIETTPQQNVRFNNAWQREKL